MLKILEFCRYKVQFICSVNIYWISTRHQVLFAATVDLVISKWLMKCRIVLMSRGKTMESYTIQGRVWCNLEWVSSFSILPEDKWDYAFCFFYLAALLLWSFFFVNSVFHGKYNGDWEEWTRRPRNVVSSLILINLVILNKLVKFLLASISWDNL